MPLWSSVSIGGMPAESFRRHGEVVFDEATRRQIGTEVVNAAYQIIEGKGATNLAIGLATARIIEAVMGDQHRVLPISTVQTGAYEISGVALSLPTLVSRKGAGDVLDIPLAVPELLGLQSSAKTLREAQASLNI